jgi:hypothetical protein
MLHYTLLLRSLFINHNIHTTGKQIVQNHLALSDVQISVLLEEATSHEMELLLSSGGRGDISIGPLIKSETQSPY